MGLITKYSATLYAGGSESNLQCNAIVNCYNDSQITPVMTAYFYHEGYFIPPNSKHIDKINLRYAISESGIAKSGLDVSRSAVLPPTTGDDVRA